MPLSSMTGFAKGQGSLDGFNWQWEIKSVNGKALDVRCRLPLGFEALEQGVRTAATEKVKRGSLQIALSVNAASRPETMRLNEAVLEQVLNAARLLQERLGGEPVRADIILGLPGVLEVAAVEPDAAAIERRNVAILVSFREALAALVLARREEGAKLKTLAEVHVGRIEKLAIQARDCPARQPSAIKARLAEQVSRLMETEAGFDADRLHQEAVLIATRADIQEEIDRLLFHIEAARTLLASGEAIGREFDFLAQEFNREANTLCSKANDKSLTAIGLELKTTIDQLREQVQNIE
ncbi:MAG: YicC/YloC family endoribonuclease [Aestuariivirga sp.]